MAYIALYRKYRPQTFAEVVGQTAIKQALSNALEQNKIVHAYLFSGPRGTGKTSMAKIFAKTVNCLNKPDAHTACNICSNCLDITSGASMDVMEIDAASNRGIDEIRDLRENVKFSPVSCTYKVYIIDEVHMLTAEAFNALLKTLEEPPKHAIFVLATTEANKIPVTIQSRCQRFDFRKLSLEELIQRIDYVAKDSGIEITPAAKQIIALQADGALRDSLSLLEQANIVHSPITEESLRLMLGSIHKEDLRAILRALADKDLSSALLTLNNLFTQGKEARNILQELLEYLRALLICKAYPQSPAILATDDPEELEDIAKLYTDERLLQIINLLSQTLQELRLSNKSSLNLELAVIKLSQQDPPIADLQKRLQALESGATSYVAAPAPVSTAALQAQELLSGVTVAPPPPAPKAQPTPVVQHTKATILKALTEQLKKDGRHAVAPCLSFATVHEFSDKRLCVTVNAGFALDRIRTGEFPVFIKQALKKLLQKELDFIAMDPAQAAAQTPKEELVPVSAQDIEQLDDTVLQAHKMLGGTISQVKK